MSNATTSAVSTLASITRSTLASVTPYTLASITLSTLTNATSSTLANATTSTLASITTGSTLASVTTSTPASLTTSTLASAVSSTSAGHEATQGDKEYSDYGETSSLPLDYYADYSEFDVFEIQDYGDTSSLSPDYNIDYQYDEFVYPGYSFERLFYMYIWGILVTITFLANLLVISVLLRKKMRNPTNMILTAIAISDSLTGLVTLPSYWAVYSKIQPAKNYIFYHYGNNNASGITNMTNVSYATDEYATNLSPLTNNNESAYQNEAMPILEHHNYTVYVVQDVYYLTKSLCRLFMIAKYFLSKTFHTVSIWLTVFLGFQRFIAVALPFRVKKLFCERNVVIICVVIAVAAPVLHIYHLVDDKAKSNKGMCSWGLEENCAGGCAYLVIAFLLRHLIPCILLLVFTVLFIMQLTKSSSMLSRFDSNRGNATMQHRDSENRRISIIVMIIGIVFLIPEVPYSGFLLYALIGKLTHVRFDLETNRAIHLAYEVSLVLSFHANFYIYTFFNRRFRKGLLRGIVYPILTCCGRTSWCGIDETKYLSSKKSFTFGSRRNKPKNETGTMVALNTIRKKPGEE